MAHPEPNARSVSPAARPGPALRALAATLATMLPVAASAEAPGAVPASGRSPTVTLIAQAPSAPVPQPVVPTPPVPSSLPAAGPPLYPTPPPDAARAGGPSRSEPAPSDDDHPICRGHSPPPTLVKLSVGSSRVLMLPEPVQRRRFGDPEVAYSRMVSPQLLYLVGQRLGSTNAIFQVAGGRCVLFDISVELDAESIQAKLAELLPQEKGIQVSSIADSVVLAGTVRDSVALDRALTIANAFARSIQSSRSTRDSAQSTRLGNEQVREGSTQLISRVINLLTVSAAQQVMIEVKVAEVSKTLIDKLGVSLAGSRTNGSFTYQLLSNFLTGSAGGTLGVVKDAANQLLIDAEKRDGMLRILAEPSVMAISGQEGSFLAGGRVLIPVAQPGGTGGSTIVLQEKEYGVGLRFTPVVLADDRINLKVSPEVSELSREGVTVSNGSLGSRSVLPLITTRRASTTVQLADGQSFAIGGLLKSSYAGSIRALPVLGELPILGALFRSTEYQDEKTELVFIVTPRIVKPLPPDYRLPTDLIGLPSRDTVLIDGRLDGPGATPPSPASPDAASPRPH